MFGDRIVTVAWFVLSFRWSLTPFNIIEMCSDCRDQAPSESLLGDGSIGG